MDLLNRSRSFAVQQRVHLMSTAASMEAASASSCAATAEQTALVGTMSSSVVSVQVCLSYLCAMFY